MKPHVNVGRASAHEPRLVLVDADKENMHLANYVNEVPEQRNVCRAFDEAPRAPIAGTSAVSMSNEKLRIALSLSGDVIAPHAMKALPFATSHAEESEGSLGRILAAVVWESFGIQGAFERLKAENGRLKFGRDCVRSVALSNNIKWWGRTSWILERRTGLARGTYKRLVEVGRFSGQRIPPEVHGRLNTLISAGGFSAYHGVFGHCLADLFGQDDRDEDLLFPLDNSRSSGNFGCGHRKPS